MNLPGNDHAGDELGTTNIKDAVLCQDKGEKKPSQDLQAQKIMHFGWRVQIASVR